MLLRLPPAQAQEPGSQNLRDLGQALLGGHQIGRQRIGARKAVIEIVEAGMPALASTAAAIDLALRSIRPPDQSPLRSIQPRTVSGSLSSSRAMSSSDLPLAVQAHCLGLPLAVGPGPAGGRAELLVGAPAAGSDLEPGGAFGALPELGIALHRAREL